MLLDICKTITLQWEKWHDTKTKIVYLTRWSVEIGKQIVRVPFLEPIRIQDKMNFWVYSSHLLLYMVISPYCSSDLNSINTVRTKIKNTNKLQNKLAKVTGYKNILHASIIAKVKGKIKIDLQITAKRCRIQLDLNWSLKF